MLNCTWQSLSSDLDGSEDDPASRGDPAQEQARTSNASNGKKGEDAQICRKHCNVVKKVRKSLQAELGPSLMTFQNVFL